MCRVILFLISGCLVACAQRELKDPPPPIVGKPQVIAEISQDRPVAVEISTPAKKIEATSPAPKREASRLWHLKRGKLQGSQPTPKILHQSKNEKTPGVTTERCWSHGKFAVVEVKSTDEVGAAEILVRTPTPEDKNLCGKEFKGPATNLKIIEGHLAGVFGDYVLVDGEDASEGLLEFQIFSALSGKQIYRGKHHPTAEFSIEDKAGKTSLTFFSDVKVRCELGVEGQECWQKVRTLNKLPEMPLPDCRGAPDVIVTARARIADVNSPNLQWLGGQATCQAAP